MQAEVAARAAQHHRTHRGVAGTGHGGGEQIHRYLQVERVAALGAVEGNERHRTAGLDLHDWS